MTPEEEEAVDEALSAAVDAFKRSAMSGVESVKSKMKDVLRVRYDDAAPESVRPDLPSPRLQLRWAKDHRYDYSHTCYYEMVIPLGEHDCRNDEKQGAVVIELSRTAVGMEGDSARFKSSDDPWFSTPFRDGSHIQWDQKALGGLLPMYTIHPDGTAVVLPPGRSALRYPSGCRRSD